MSILHRYILVELARVFALGLAAFTAIFVMVGVVQEATQQGLGLWQALCLVPFVVPVSLPFTIPATVLLATTIVYGRLAADNELVAAKSAGINALYLVAPALMVGVVLSFFTLFLYDRVIPVANYRLRTAFVKNVEDMVYNMLRREGAIKASGVPYEIYVQEVQGKTLINTAFKRRNETGAYDLVVFAKRAGLEFDLEKTLVNVHMYDAEVTKISETGVQEVGVDAKGYKDFQIALPKLADTKKGIRDMTIREVQDQQTELSRALEKSCMLWAFDTAVSTSGGHMSDIRWGSLAELVGRWKNLQRELRRLECEPAFRRAISFGCLSFILLGCPVAILFQRGDYLSAFISCFLPIVALYYPLLMFGLNLSKEGLAPPSILWVGNAILALLGLAVFRPVLRH
ncbi:MAG: LptF/LptG family permease [Planctomycetes bacterium]|nr:LptF/LptG family permease [Planctomycetota bacterium]